MRRHLHVVARLTPRQLILRRGAITERHYGIRCHRTIHRLVLHRRLLSSPSAGSAWPPEAEETSSECAHRDHVGLFYSRWDSPAAAAGNLRGGRATVRSIRP